MGEVERLKTQYPAIRGIGFARNYGKSAALYCGFAAAEGEVVITMDADLQDSPDEIPELRRMILEEGYDLVSGWKRNATTRSANAGPANSSTGRPGRAGHPAPRFQLRAESLPPQGGEGHRGLRRDAPLHSVPGQAGRVPAASARRSSTIAPASTAVRNSASNAR